MIWIYTASVFLFVYTLLIPVPAAAYLLPLIGSGGVVISMLVGIIAALCAALFLIFYNVRRFILRIMNKSKAPAPTSENPLDQ